VGKKKKKQGARWVETSKKMTGTCEQKRVKRRGKKKKEKSNTTTDGWKKK